MPFSSTKSFSEGASTNAAIVDTAFAAPAEEHGEKGGEANFHGRSKGKCGRGDCVCLWRKRFVCMCV